MSERQEQLQQRLESVSWSSHSSNLTKEQIETAELTLMRLTRGERRSIYSTDLDNELQNDDDDNEEDYNEEER